MISVGSFLRYCYATFILLWLRWMEKARPEVDVLTNDFQWSMVAKPIAYLSLLACIASSWVCRERQSERDLLKEKNARLEERVKGLEAERAALRQEVLHLREVRGQTLSSRYREMPPSKVEAMEEQREKWEKLSEVAQALGLKQGSVFADVGAGHGFFAIRFAQRVGTTGHVFAVETDEELVRRIKRRIQKLGLKNIEVLYGRTDNPMFPMGLLDSVLIADAYHEMKEYGSLLSNLRKALKPEGHLVVLDYFRPTMKWESRDWQVSDHNIDPELVKAELQKAGFEITDFKDSFNQDPIEHIPIYLLTARPSQKSGGN